MPKRKAVGRKPVWDQPIFVIPLSREARGTQVLDPRTMCPLGPEPDRRCENGSACGYHGGVVTILGWRYVVCMAPAEDVCEVLEQRDWCPRSV